MTSRALWAATFAAAVCLGASAAEPLRVGLELGSPSAVIVLRPAPFDIKVGYDFTGVGSDAESDFFHISGDYRIIDRRPLVDFVSFYLGAGGYLQILTGDVQDNFVLGARLPVGLQAFLLEDKLEIFVEIAPTVKFLPTILAFDDWHGFIGFTVPLSIFGSR